MSHSFGSFVFHLDKESGSGSERGNRDGTVPRQKWIRLSGLFTFATLPKNVLLCNLKGPDLGLGKHMRALFRRVGLCRGIIVVSS